ncbi:MAG: hypothetical protein V8S38_01210 [Lachnospiraceae bacterium]
MYLRVKYAETENGICVLRCYGYEQTLVIPDELMGRPVTELAPYACSSSDPGDRWKKYEIQETVLHEEEKLPGEEQELAGELLTEVYLPKTSEKNRRLCLLFLQAIKNPSCAGRTGRYRGRRLYVVQGIEPSDLSKYSMGKQSRLQRPLRVYTGTGSVAFFCGRNNAYSDFPGVL